MNKTILLILLTLLLSACENQTSQSNYSPTTNDAYNSIKYVKFDTSLTQNGQRVIKLSRTPSMAGNTRRASFSLQDIWDEADHYRNQAEDILNEAEEIGCDDAISSSRDALRYFDECAGTDDYSDAETLLEEALSELSDARSYLDDCQDAYESNEGNC
jgi:hypothetical protein